MMPGVVSSGTRPPRCVRGRAGEPARRLRRVLAVLGYPLALAACASTPVACTQIGCSSGISVTVEGFRASASNPVDVHACLGTVCRERAVTDEPSVVFIDAGAGPGMSSAIAAVRVTRGEDVLVDVRRELALHKIVPNGEHCGPVCYVAFAVVNPTGLRAA